MLLLIFSVIFKKHNAISIYAIQKWHL